MPSVLVRNLGGVATGLLDRPFVDATCLHAIDGVIRSIGREPVDAETEVDAGGNLAVPGLIDSHCHPLLGGWSPVMDATDWVTQYVHGGVTTFVSAGEVVMPGFPMNPPDPRFVKHLALVCKRSYDTVRPAGARVIGGTPVLVPGLVEGDFDEFAAAGIRLVKFIYYDYDRAPEGEAQRYVAWARARGLKVKIHTGGSSYVGESIPTGADRVLAVGPDILGHLNGGPIPAASDDVERLVRHTRCPYEIVPGGNPRTTDLILRLTMALGAYDRLLLGTDTPGGTGVMPRAMLRLVSDVASRGIPAPLAIAAGTGNVARAHGLDVGVLDVGRPADLVLLGPIRGSAGNTALQALEQGDIPGVAMVITDGHVRVTRSRLTPPPLRPARVVRTPFTIGL